MYPGYYTNKTIKEVTRVFLYPSTRVPDSDKTGVPSSPPPPQKKRKYQERQGDPPCFYFRLVLNLSQDRVIPIPYYYIIDNNHICFQVIKLELSFSRNQKCSLHLVVILLSPLPPPPPPQNTDESILPSWGCPQVKILFCPCKKSFICQCCSIKLAEYWLCSLKFILVHKNARQLSWPGAWLIKNMNFLKITWLAFFVLSSFSV